MISPDFRGTQQFISIHIGTEGLNPFINSEMNCEEKLAFPNFNWDEKCR